MRPVLAENGGWALFNGTPRGLNHFHQMAQQAQDNKDWFYQKLSCLDTGFPTLEDIESERRAGMPESLIEQEFYTSWTSSSEDVLIPLDKVQACMSLELPENAYNFAPRIIGVAPAYAEKGDRAVIVRRQGRKVWPLEKYQGLDPMALAARVADHMRVWKAHYCFIDAGRGEAVWSRLFQLGFEARVIPVHFSGKTYDDLYHMKKDQIWGRMKQGICHPELPWDLPNDPDLAYDLSQPTFVINDRGKLQIESKTHLKGRGVRSTDCGDALALTCSEELDETPILTQEMERLGVTQEIFDQLQSIRSGFAEYNPLEYMDSVRN
jgi:hypothetical protein